MTEPNRPPDDGLRVLCVTGDAVAPYRPALAHLRIAVFHDFPYLYDGNLAYEEQYLETYSASPESLFVLVFDGEAIVGASTGLPMEQAEEAFQAPLRNHGYDPADVFYFGESVLDPAYRGRGLGVRFFAEREAYARRLGRFTHTAFCAVDRPADHPLRPSDYAPLDAFWRKRGYKKHPGLQATFRWRDVGETEETSKTLTFWLKHL